MGQGRWQPEVKETSGPREGGSRDGGPGKEEKDVEDNDEVAPTRNMKPCTIMSTQSNYLTVTR